MSQGQANSSFPITGSTKSMGMFVDYYGLADEGSFFIATNATPGTAIATTTSVVDDATGATTHAQQKPVMLIQNQNSVSQGYNIYLMYLKMFIVQIPTSATVWRYAMRLDPLSTKITTPGTVITPQNPNGASSTLSRAYINFGAITTTDSTSSPQQRLVANGSVSQAIPVANDEWFFNFGATFASIDSSITSANSKRMSFPVPPIVIPPGWTWTLEMWGASNAAAPSWEFELGYAERPQGQ
jgi:hypothetical protein